MTDKQRLLCLAPARATPGMALARDLTDREGKPLLAAGTVLDVAMLDRLMRRGVATVTVLVADTRDAEALASEREAAEKRIAHIFRGTSSPARESLRSAVLAYRLEAAQ